MIRTAPRGASPVHLPLQRVALCLDCDECFDVGYVACPACGSETSTSLARFLETAPSEPLGKLLAATRGGRRPARGRSQAREIARYLFIVARNRPKLYEHVKRVFFGDDTVKVILDRHVAERRQRKVPPASERRRGDRRAQSSVDDQLRALGWAIVLADLTRSVRSADIRDRRR